ncbi:MAG: biotin-dependent carboxyltransferase family protein [Carbonactinosporaceae bacterium]
MKTLEVLETGPLTTVQDLGRPGMAALGVGQAGAADRGALRLANRLVGNPEGAAALEVTVGGLAVRARGELTVALAGAPCPITLDGRREACHTVLHLPAGAELRLGVPETGLRSYLAVRGGVDVAPVLGSRSTDVLAGLGPERPVAGTALPVGPAPAGWPSVDHAPVPASPGGELTLRVVPGPREDWFTAEALDMLFHAAYTVTPESNRVGMRLAGPPLARAREGELPSEGMALGALQVPPSGQPTLFLADHPVTGGYPVAAVVVDADVDAAAQARPGQRLRFRPQREEARL